jgi:uncharacterized protein (DUF2147 family)
MSFQLKKNACLAAVLVAMTASSWAQMTPVGRWHSIDDKTGETKSEVLITEANGMLTGKVEKLLRKGADQAKRCTECTDDRKDKPVIGLELIRNSKKTEGKDVWEGGKIVDPETGTVYSVKLTPIEEGKKLEVRGFKGISLLGRTQVWVRVPDAGN